MLLTTKPQTARLSAVKEKAAEFTGKLKSQKSKASHLFPLIAMGKQTTWLKKTTTLTLSPRDEKSVRRKTGFKNTRNMLEIP